jgi:hypothetical protein
MIQCEVLSQKDPNEVTQAPDPFTKNNIIEHPLPFDLGQPVLGNGLQAHGLDNVDWEPWPDQGNNQ